MILVKSFVTLSKELLGKCENVYILSEKFSQDPLEEHFSRQRRKGGCSDNPTLEEFGRQEVILNVMDSNLISDLRGNTRGRQLGEFKLDSRDTRVLPKKPRR